MRTQTDRCEQEQINEIDGYLELGMEGEALELIRDTLGKGDIPGDEFCTCVFALLQSERPEPWKDLVETAYRRLSRPVSDRVRSAMLNYYFRVGDSKKAFVFFPRRSTKFFDAWTMMQVCLELNRLDEAKRVARYCRGNLACAEDDFTKASMADALASYYLRIGNCDEALKLWSEAPVEPAFHRQTLTGVVKARLMQALQATKTGLAIARPLKEQIDVDTVIPLPGNTRAIANDSERDLKELQREIERLLSQGQN